MEQLSDNELVAAYLKGQEQALVILVKRYLGPLYGFAYRYVNNSQTAEDIVQEAFIKAWRNLKKFKSDKPFKTWLYAIVRNVAIDYLRKQKIIVLSSLDEINDDGEYNIQLIDNQPLPLEVFSRAELKEELTKALNKLPLAQKEVILWHLEQGFTFQEVADTLGKSVNTVKSRYLRGLANLRQFLVK
ncbi:MAG: RNA polymerase sigma factor [Patescibacteria group bacterium]